MGAPISDNLSSAYTKLNIRECVSQAFSKRNFFCDINPDSGRFLASAFFFRGQDLREQEIDQCLNRLREKRGDDFVEWIPNNLLSSLIRVPSQLSPLSALWLGTRALVEKSSSVWIVSLPQCTGREPFFTSTRKG